MKILVAIILAAVQPNPRAASVRLLDVPFLSQSELLCGGAAVAMVMRYWGARGVRAEDFASLVDEGAGGIRQSALADAVRARGWTVLPVTSAGGSADPLAAELARQRPVVALIEDRPGRYHYVVIVGSTGDRIVLHDPALAPFRVLARDAFDRSWAPTQRWAIVLLPAEGRITPSADASSLTAGADAPPAASDPCAALAAEGTRLAGSGDRDAAARALETSVALCPGSAAAHVELAGLRFLDRRWREASALAARAAALNPGDPHAWRLLASSRFVDGDEAGALAAWNRVGEPRVDLVRVSGLVRTRHRVVEALVDATPGSLLTGGSLARARRRVAALPAQSGSRVGYRPAPGGLADVDVALVERPVVPSLPVVLFRGAHAIVEREVLADASSLARGGERLTLAWRFWERRPAVTIRAEAPSLFGVHGLWTVEGLWARQPYAASGGAIVTEERRRAAVRYADWLSGATRAEAGAGVDRWRGRSTSLFVAAALERRLLADTVAARVEASAWPSRDARVAAGAVRVAWRAGDAGPIALGVRSGLEAASARAPLDLWPGAGTGHARVPRLRAHPLLEAGVVRGAAFGRTLAQASVDVERTLWSRGLLQVDAAAFADAARAWRTLSGDRRLHVDAGGGLRLRTPGSDGAIVLELARGLRDGRTTFSAGWTRGWPGW